MERVERVIRGERRDNDSKRIEVVEQCGN